MTKLLEYLEQVSSHYHNGTGMIGGVHLDEGAVRRMSGLNLEIDFDIYVGGKPFLEVTL